MKISKIYLDVCSLLFACFLVCGSILRPVVTYASPYDLMINTDSNALMTLDLNDDYSIAPFSALGSVDNTVDLSKLKVGVFVTNGSNGYYIVKTPTIQNNKLHLKITDSDILAGYHIWLVRVYFKDTGINVLPPSGKYKFSFDMSNEFNFDYRFVGIDTIKNYNNAASLNGSADISNYCDLENGEAYCSGVVLDIGSVDAFTLALIIDEKYGNIRNFDSTMSFRFERTSANSNFTMGGTITDADTNEEISSGLSDLSSSVDSMTEDLSSAAENLEYISTSQNLIIQGIDNVVMHISDQLFAFWNQLFNLIHVPTMAKMDDIIDAINNMDLEIEVNLDGLKTTINNMSTAIQNKLQSVTDTITGGFDNSGIEQNGNELDSSITEFEEAEQNVLESVNDSLNDFEFDTDLSEYKNIVQVISDFLQELYDSSGGFKLVINLSLMLSVASIVIGVYRFKEGG